MQHLFFYVAIQDQDFDVIEQNVIISPETIPTCLPLTLRNDEILEINETVTLRITPSFQDESVIEISPLHDQFRIVIVDDDG